MKRIPAYKQRRRLAERAAFFAAVQARTHCPAAVLGGWVRCARCFAALKAGAA